LGRKNVLPDIGESCIICDEDLDCDDADSGTSDVCHEPGTVGSYCTNGDIACEGDSDCGVDGLIGDRG